jgi:hypothetical protein
MNLHQYVLKIKSDQSINLDRFILLLPGQYKSQWRSIFSSEKDRTKKNSYKLTIIKQQTFDVLFNRSLPSTNRIEAAERGDSHREKTSFSFLLLFHQAINNTLPKEIDSCPDVVVINTNGVQQNFTSKRHLLIIENQENFFRWSEFLSVLTKLCSLDDIKENFTLADFDIAFGSGNNITNAKNICFFKQYQCITCIFDYDFGGLSIFKSLSTLCANTDTQEKIKLRFLQPRKTHLSDSNFVKHYFNKTPKNSKQWQLAIALASELGFNELAYAYNESKSFMEQESYLSAPLTS